jgi:thiol-disulfide isomerase/thioredoxin
MTRAAITATLVVALSSQVFGLVLGQGEKPAPEFELKDVEGRALRLSDYEGRVVLLNFWATWCAPCRAEMPDLVNLTPSRIRSLLKAKRKAYDFPVVYLAAWLPPRIVDIYSSSRSIAFVCSSTHFGLGQAAPVSRSSSIRCALNRVKQAPIRCVISFA